MLLHWDLLAGSFCFAGEIHVEHILISIELPCNLHHITLQSAS